MTAFAKKTIYLVRHGFTAWNRVDKCMGQQDIPLDTDGWNQARALANYFANRSVDSVVTSDLQRTRETAEPLCEQKGIKAETDVRLREIHYGELEGLTPQEWPQRFPDLVRTWAFDSYDIAPPGGESREELIRRSSAVLEERVASDAENIVFVAHGGTIMALLTYVVFRSANLPINRSLGIFRVENGSITTLSRKRDRWRIECVNQSSE